MKVLTSSSPRRWALAALALIVAFCAVLLGLSSGGSAKSDAVGADVAPHVGKIFTPRSEPSNWQVDYPIVLPNGYESVGGITTNSSGSKIWALAQGVSVTSSGVRQPLETLFEWSEGGTLLNSYQIDWQNPALDAGQDTPIAVDSNGDVWVGINSSLLELKVDADTLASVSLPPADLAALGSGSGSLPSVSNAAASDPVDALAVDSGGSIVVGRMFATTLQVVNATSLSVSTAELPSGTNLIGLGSTDLASPVGGGAIAASLYAGNGVEEVGLWTGSTWQTVTPQCPALGVSFSGSSIVESGLGCQQIVDTTGQSETIASGLKGLRVLNLPQGANGPLGYVDGHWISFGPFNKFDASLLSKVSTILSLGTQTVKVGGPISPPATVRVPPSALRTHTIIQPVIIGKYASPVRNSEWFVPATSGRIIIGVIRYR